MEGSKLKSTGKRQARKAKGFIHTLEAILATFLVIGFVTFIMPALREPTESGQIERLRVSERLQTLDESGGLSGYVAENSTNLSALKDKLASESNLSYGYAVSSVSYFAESAVGNRQMDISQTNASNITEVTVTAYKSDGVLLLETVVWDSSGPKDIFAIGPSVNLSTIRMGPASIRISLVSLATSGEYRYRIRKTEATGAIPENSSVWTSSYLPSSGNLNVFSNSSQP